MKKYSGELFAIFGEMENSQAEGPMGEVEVEEERIWSMKWKKSCKTVHHRRRATIIDCPHLWKARQSIQPNLSCFYIAFNNQDIVFISQYVTASMQVKTEYTFNAFNTELRGSWLMVP